MVKTAMMVHLVVLDLPVSRVFPEQWVTLESTDGQELKDKLAYPDNVVVMVAMGIQVKTVWTAYLDEAANLELQRSDLKEPMASQVWTETEETAEIPDFPEYLVKRVSEEDEEATSPVHLVSMVHVENPVEMVNPDSVVRPESLVK